MSTIAGAHGGIKVGLLFDFVFPPPGSWDVRQDFLDALVLTFDEALGAGLLDRPVELVERSVEGLPRGAVKPVVDAWQELADAGCVLVIGPLISDNAVALRDHVELRGQVPSLSWCGSEEWLGEWTFALSDGSLSEEPYVLADLIAAAGHRRIGVSVERSHIGSEYLVHLQDACERTGLDIVATAAIAQTAVDASELVGVLHQAKPDALVHLGFGLGMVRINAALATAGWEPPRYTTTAWETGYLNDDLFAAFTGWIGLEHYDEDNPVATAFLDRFAARFGRRPEYGYPLYGHDVGRIVAHALANAEPISPAGVKRGLERVKMLPAACGSPGTRISYGRWKRNGWHGAGYLVAREVAPDLKSTVLRGRVRGG